MTSLSHNTPGRRKDVGEILRDVRIPRKTESEWQRVENDLFVRLDSTRSPGNAFGFSFAFPFRPIVAWAAIAALVLAVTGTGIVISMQNVVSDSTAKLESASGNVLVALGGLGPVLPAGKSAFSGVAAKTVFETPSGASAIVRLDKGSVLQLLPCSRLTLVASNEGKQICFLSNGSVYVKVNKRKPGQVFEIRTHCACCRVIGTAFKVDAAGNRRTTLSVFQGTVRFSPAPGISGKETFVETGRFASLGGDAPVSGLLLPDQTPFHDISLLGMLVDTSEHGGLLDINSDPSGAKILVNGAMAGKTPLIVRAPGASCSVKILADGCAPWDTSFAFGAGRVCNVRSSLRPLSGPSQEPKARRARVVGYVKSFAPNRETCETELETMPDYVEALVDMSSGEYQAALAIFDSLSNSGLIDIKARMCLMDKINACYSKLGDFKKAAETLEDRYQKAQTTIDKGQLLWEMATMRANCLGDYQGAEMALVEFLILQPNAIWAHSAYGKLAEIQYYLNKFDIAAETYNRHIATFPDDPDIDKSMFNVACILDRDLNNCEKAAHWYSRLIDSFHTSKYRAVAFFRRGECELRLGKISESERDFTTYMRLAPQGTLSDACAANIKKIKSLQ